MNGRPGMDAIAIHASLGAQGWRDVLVSAGIGESFLRNKHGPCPCCGGKDRFRFDNKHGRGDYYCNQCGAGDGFKLVMGVLSMTFPEARKRVMECGGLTEVEARSYAPISRQQDPEEIARPTRRVTQLLRESCAVEDCDPAWLYLDTRQLWPLPAGHGLRAHTSVEYWHDKRCIGKYPALLSAVRDRAGDLVTVHVTYLDQLGKKLEGFEPRKILSGMNGRDGCAVRLMKLEGNTMGIGEGIETALSAARLAGVPVWSALNSVLLSKFEPPEQIGKLIIFADRDVAGLDAATKLMERLQEKVRLEIRTPPEKDWNDVLRSAA